MYVFSTLILIALTASPASEAPQQFIEQLGSDSFQIREAASEQLGNLGEAARPVLVKHRNHADPEVQFRVRRLLQELDGNVRPLPPEMEHKLKSEPSDILVSLKAINRSRRPVRVFWIGFDGTRSPEEGLQRFLKPGETYRWGTTYESHAWVVTDENGKALSVYVIGDHNATIVIRDP